jgi:hypothetical protein
MLINYELQLRRITPEEAERLRMAVNGELRVYFDLRGQTLAGDWLKSYNE